MPFFVVHLSVLSRSGELCFTSIIVKPEGGGGEGEGRSYVTYVGAFDFQKNCLVKIPTVKP